MYPLRHNPCHFRKCYSPAYQPLYHFNDLLLAFASLARLDAMSRWCQFYGSSQPVIPHKLFHYVFLIGVMASSIAQPGGSFNGSNFVQSADDNEADDFYMEDPARGNSPEALDSDNDEGPLNVDRAIDFPFEPDEIDVQREMVVMTGTMLALNQSLTKTQKSQMELEEKRKRREAEWTPKKVRRKWRTFQQIFRLSWVLQADQEDPQHY